MKYLDSDKTENILHCLEFTAAFDIFENISYQHKTPLKCEGPFLVKGNKKLKEKCLFKFKVQQL